MTSRPVSPTRRACALAPSRAARTCSRPHRSPTPRPASRGWDRRAARETGTERDDTLLGAHGSDVIAGGPGDDIIWGDRLHTDGGFSASDRLVGGAGDDVIYGGRGRNRMDGG